MDLCKGAALKFQAFERLLEDNPEWVDKVMLLNIMLPGSVAQKERDYVSETVMERVKKIKERFGDDVIRVEKVNSLSFDRTLALYRACSVGLISTFWDGLNVGPYEFRAAQDDSPGSLIISEFMGCSRSLSGVQRVNPWDLKETAQTILNALQQGPAQRSGHHKRRFDYVMAHTAEAWGNNFVAALNEAATKVADNKFVQVGFGSCSRLVALRTNFDHLDDMEQLSDMFQKAGRRIILLDYDGTLIPVEDNGFRGPSRQAIRALRALCEDTRSIVFVVSGRGRSYLQEWFGSIENLGLAAEKGYFVRWPKRWQGLRKDTSKSEWEMVCKANMKWKTLAMEVVEEYTAHVDGSWIEDKESAIVWHFDDCDVDFGKLQAGELDKYLMRIVNPEHAEVTVSAFSRHLEVKPKGVGKAEITQLILKRFLRDQPKTSPPFILAVGDDASDEVMFEAVLGRWDKGVDDRANALENLRGYKKNTKQKAKSALKSSDKHTFTCCVGMKPSCAQYYLHDHEDVIDVLTSLGKAVNRPTGRGQSHR